MEGLEEEGTRWTGVVEFLIIVDRSVRSSEFHES